MNVKTLIKITAKKLKMSRAATKIVVDAFLNEMKSCFPEEKEIRIEGLGTLYLTKRKKLMARHPIKGIPIEVPEKNVIRFRMSEKLKDKLNQNL